MLVTKEQQEALITNYVKSGRNQDECIGFIQGIQKIMELISKIDSKIDVIEKQTSTQWFAEQLEKHHTNIDIKNTVVFQQANEMFCKQIKKAFIEGTHVGYNQNSKSEEEYYNETYNK